MTHLSIPPTGSRRLAPTPPSMSILAGARAVRTPAGDRPSLSIVLLAYQEEARIGRSMVELSGFLARSGLVGVEVVVVAADRPDGTCDRTVDIVEGKRALFEHLRVICPGRQKGKGRDARAGMLAARGRRRIFMDADLATPLHHLPVALGLVEEGNAVVIGVRDLTSSHTGPRRWLSQLGNLLVRAVLLPGIKDSQCGFKLFSADAAEDIFGRQTIDGWGFDMEVLAIARLRHHAVATVEVKDWQDVAGGSFHGNALAGTLRTLLELLVIRQRTLSGRYDDPVRRPRLQPPLHHAA